MQYDAEPDRRWTRPTPGDVLPRAVDRLLARFIEDDRHSVDLEAQILERLSVEQVQRLQHYRGFARGVRSSFFDLALNRRGDGAERDADFGLLGAPAEDRGDHGAARNLALALADLPVIFQQGLRLHAVHAGIDQEAGRETMVIT